MVEKFACVQARRDNTMKAAGTLAVGLAAGVVMSALALDLTDAAVAGAILAAGAARSLQSNIKRPTCYQWAFDNVYSILLLPLKDANSSTIDVRV